MTPTGDSTNDPEQAEPKRSLAERVDTQSMKALRDWVEEAEQRDGERVIDAGRAVGEIVIPALTDLAICVSMIAQEVDALKRPVNHGD